MSIGFILISCRSQKALTNIQEYANVECVQLAGNGDCIVKIQVIVKKIGQAADIATKTAVNDLIFKGIHGTPENRIQDIKPLIQDNNLIEMKQGFFDTFFSSGAYRQYGEIIDGLVPEVIKTSKGYKVTYIITLQQDKLRKTLESEGIIKSLSNRF